MTLKIQNGDYVTDGCGGLERVEGTQALLQRVLFRLKARRGQFPFLETLGSRLWQLGQVSSCLLYTSPSPRDGATSRMPSSA